MLIAKCKQFDAVDHLGNNILHYACIFVCSQTKLHVKFYAVLMLFSFLEERTSCGKSFTAKYILFIY